MMFEPKIAELGTLIKVMAFENSSPSLPKALKVQSQKENTFYYLIVIGGVFLCVTLLLMFYKKYKHLKEMYAKLE